MSVPSNTLPMQTRAAPLTSVNSDSRTFDLVWTTGVGVQRYDWRNDRYYTEVLEVSAEAIDLSRLQNGAPLLNTHKQWDLENVIGVVESARVENGEGSSTVRFSKRPELEGLWLDVESRVIRNVSVGYQILQMRMEQDAAGAWVYTATRWMPTEISLVPVGADAACGTRSQTTAVEFPCEIINSPQQRQENAMTPEEIAAAALAEQQRLAAAAVTTDAAAAVSVTAAVTAERSRINEIRTLVKSVGLPETDAQPLIDAGSTLDAARTAVLIKLAENSAQNPTRGHVNVQVTGDESVTRRQAIADAVLHRSGALKDDSGKLIALPENAREFRGMSLPELARYSLEKQGVNVKGLDRSEVIARSLMTGSDFIVALSNAVGRTLRQGYEIAPRSFTRWAREGRLNDFRPATRIAIANQMTLLKTNDHGEFTRGFMGDSGEQIQLSTYGRIIGITRRTIINDDLDIFGRIPLAAAQGATAMESALVYGVLNNNPNMGDGVALFHASHGNLGAAASISVDSIGAARAAMRVQKEPLNKEPLNLEPTYLMVPAALETKAQQFISQAFLAAKTVDINPFAGGLELIVEPRLDAASTTAWYLAAKTGLVDTIEYSYLDGAAGLQVATRDSFASGSDFDGVEIKAFEDFGVAAIDYRGLYKNPGL